MKSFNIFLVRLALSAVIASAISFLFFDGLSCIKTPLLAVGLLVFAYIFESSRKKD